MAIDEWGMSMQKDDDEITEELPEAKLIILSPSEVSKLLHKSLRWVYHHAPELGASRIGGSWIFTEEGLNDALQRARRMEGDQVISEERGPRSRVGKPHKKKLKNPEIDDPHGLAPFVRKKPYHPDY